MTTTPVSDLFLVVDVGLEGLFRYDPADSSTADNTGTVVVSAGGARFKRVFTGPYNVRWFGARGDGSSDDTAAIQATVDLAFEPRPGEEARSRSAVHLPQGNYQITAPILLPANGVGILISGDGGMQTWISPHDSVASLDSIFAFGEGATPSKFEFTRLHLAGKSKTKYGVYAPKITASNFCDLRLRHFTAAGLAIGEGWINNIERCTISYCVDGIQSAGSALNKINIVDCNIDKCDTGIHLTHSGSAVQISGCTIENSTVCAVNVHAQIQGLDISDNHLERNGTTGYRFTNPDRLVHATIIVNGQADSAANIGAVSTPWPPGAVRISNNFVSLLRVPEPAVFVAGYTCYGGMQITENTLEDWVNTPPRTDTILLTGTTKTGLGSRVDNLSIRGNGRRWRPKEMNVTLNALTVEDLAGASTALHDAVIEGVVRTNYAPDPVRFAPVSRPMGGQWRQSSVVYRNRASWELTGAGEWGFTLDVDEHPELAGRFVYLACWAKASTTATGPVLSTSQLGPNTTDNAVDTSWHVVSYIDKMPASGAVTFSIGTTSDDPANSVYFVQPVLSEVGARFDTF